jgi:hypothetical protein
MIRRFLLDSMIHDKLMDEPGALELATELVSRGSLTLLSTHIQNDEIARTPDAERAARLATVPTESVPTYGFVVGMSRIGMARIGHAEPIDALRAGNLDHTEDALVGATAQYEDATLVTEDRRLASRARKQGIAVMDWDEFHAMLGGLGKA